MTDLTLQRGLVIALTLGLLLFVFELVRRKHLSERYAILWLLAAATLFVLAVWKGLLTSLSHDVGISYPPSALFAIAIGLIVVLLMYFSLVVSRLSDQNKILAQRLSLLQHRIEESVADGHEHPLPGADAAPLPDRRAELEREPEPGAAATAEELSRSR
jgi:hypothetical protein